MLGLGQSHTCSAVPNLKPELKVDAPTMDHFRGGLVAHRTLCTFTFTPHCLQAYKTHQTFLLRFIKPKSPSGNPLNAP